MSLRRVNDPYFFVNIHPAEISIIVTLGRNFPLLKIENVQNKAIYENGAKTVKINAIYTRFRKDSVYLVTTRFVTLCSVNYPYLIFRQKTHLRLLCIVKFGAKNHLKYVDSRI